MTENLGRKVTFTVLFLLISLAFLLFSEPPFTLGLDIQGGTRLTYSIDIDEARAAGTVDSSETDAEVIDGLLAVIRNRVDPEGVRDPIIRAVGTDRIVIELPGTLGLPSKEAETTLTGALAPFVENEILTLANTADFPEAGTIEIGGERIKYDSRSDTGVTIISRSDLNANHEVGSTAKLLSDDAFKSAIESLGELSFQIVATAGTMPADTDLESERAKLDKWAEANPNSPLVAFNKLKPENGGPHPTLEWVPQSEKDVRFAGQPELQRAVALERPAGTDDHFTGSALSRVYPSRDDFGFPAVGFEIAPSRRNDFGDFTGSNEGRQMAIVLNGEVRSAPKLGERLSSGGRIFGSFSDEEVKELITVLRSGSLTIKPKLENDERVGATLGEEYVTRGAYSGLLAVAAVFGFIIFYYRRLGVLASIALLLNFVLLLGALSFVHATITLPGVAGIILTVGMAVDANILIFDRIREEMDKGRNIKQASKEGFDKAMPAILDANITTFLTALILRFVGTGPVRGFAVTLMWGIVTSVFAALVISRVLVHLSLERGTKKFTIGQWMVHAKYKFMNKTKLALTISMIAVIASVVGFVLEDPGKKLGIDFIGGAEAQLRTAKGESVDTMRQRIKAIDVIGNSADVKSVLSSETESGKFTLFRVTCKTTDGSTEIEDSSEVRGLLRSGLADLLLEDAIHVEVTDRTNSADASVRLLFEGQHPTADIAAVLAAVGLNDAQVTTTATPNEYVATATTAFGRSADSVEAELDAAFRTAEDSNQTSYSLARGIPSSSLVSAQVVGELQNKALLALVFSMFVIVLYIRVRFAEYSYGFAAVAAVLHDVLIALGILTLANRIGFLNGEMTLPMIAAFLTILGYSLNDTIVIFDRVRENLPRVKKPLSDVLDLSINQTLSRTILTSFTTFLSVGLLYAFNFGTGNVLESFSFAMMIGVLTGTYSTIFIANPVLLWFEKRAGRVDAAGFIIEAAAPKPSRSTKTGDTSAAQV